MSIMQAATAFRKRWSQDNADATGNPWFLGWIGLVVVFLLVNFVFVLFAVTSNPGLVVEDYYEKGREYEQNAIKLHTARNELAWTTRLDIPDTITTGVPGVFRFIAVDKAGLPVRDAEVILHAYRPSSVDADFDIPMQRVADGVYQGELRFDLQGVWDLTVRVARGDLVYQQSRRIRVAVP